MSFNSSLIDIALIDNSNIVSSTNAYIDGAIIDDSQIDPIVFSSLIDCALINVATIDFIREYPFSAYIDSAMIDISLIEQNFKLYDVDVSLAKLGIVKQISIDLLLSTGANVWLAGWGRRVSHTILPTLNAGLNYPICLKVYQGVGVNGTEVYDGETVGSIYCQTYCNNDFSDIRFALNDGTLLDYYKLLYTTGGGAYAIFFVKIPYYLDVNSVKIYVYYDNPPATDASNFVNTFYEGDTFTRPDSYDLGTTEIGLRTWLKYKGTALRATLDTIAQIKTDELLIQADNVIATKYDSWYTNVFLPSISTKFDTWHYATLLYNSIITEYDQWEPQQWYRDVIDTARINASFIEYYFKIDWATIDSPQIDYQALIGTEDGDSPYAGIIATRTETLTFSAGDYISCVDTDRGLTIRLSTDVTTDVGVLLDFDNDNMTWTVRVWDCNIIPSGSTLNIQGGTGVGTLSIDAIYTNGKSAGSCGAQIQCASINTLFVGGQDYAKIDVDTIDRDRNADMFVATGHSTTVQSDSRIDSGTIDTGYVP